MTTGTVTIDLVPDARAAALLLCFEGTTTAKTVGRKGPALIHSISTTRFQATKRLEFDTDHGFRHADTDISSQTQLRHPAFGAVPPGLRGELVRCVARRRAAQKYPQAKAIAASKARRRVCDSLDRQINARLQQINQVLWIIEPLVFELRRTTGEKWTFSISHRALCAVLHSVALQSASEALTSPAPWESSEADDMNFLADLWLARSEVTVDWTNLEMTLSNAARVWQELAREVEAGREPPGEPRADLPLLSVTTQEFGAWRRLVLYEVAEQPSLDSQKP